MTDDTVRTVDIERTSIGRYVVRNVRGGSITIGTGEDDSFTPVELLLAAIGGCTAIDVDLITSRRAEPSERCVSTFLRRVGQ
jgi:putative redox protein